MATKSAMLQALYGSFIDAQLNMTSDFLRDASKGEYGIDKLSKDWARMTAFALDSAHTACGLLIEQADVVKLETNLTKNKSGKVVAVNMIPDPGEGTVVVAASMTPMSSPKNPALPVKVDLSNNRSHIVCTISIGKAVANESYSTTVRRKGQVGDEFFKLILEVKKY